MFKYANELARLALVLALPALAGCCGNGVRSPDECPLPPAPACEVEGILAYNLGRGISTNSTAVRLARSVDAGPCEENCRATPVPACQPASPAFSAVVAFPDGAGVGEEYVLPDDAAAIPGVTPTVVLIPSAGPAPAREVNPRKEADGAFRVPAEPKSETPAAPVSDAAVKAGPEIAVVPELPEPQSDPEQAVKPVAVIDKYESLKRTSGTDSESRVAATRRILPPVPEVSDINAVVDAILSPAETDRPAAETSSLPEVELPPSLD